MGHILAEDGKPVAGARVVVREAGAEFVTDTSGSFRLTGLPLGTHNVEVLALGFMPMRTAVDLRPDADAVAMFHASRRVQALDEVTVREGLDRSGFERRRRQGTGYFLDAQAIEKSGLQSLPMLLSAAPMLRTNGLDLSGQPVITGRGRCVPSYFVDGQPMLAGVPIGTIRDIGGIEVYGSSTEAPPQFASPNQDIRLGADGRSRGAPNLNAFCATILIWTRAYVR